MSSGTVPLPAGNRALSNSDPFYTNDDVEVLHSIVVLAEELLPTLPERERLPTNALFGAYYDILPRLGLDADHDNRYARILFKIGGLSGPQGLYDKFEAILAKMGIEIEIEAEERGERASRYEGSEAVTESIAGGDIVRPQTRRRRNSESTLWDIEPRQSPQQARRRNSFSGAIYPQVLPHFGSFPEEPITQTFFQEEDINFVDENEDVEEEEDESHPNHNVRAWLASRPGESRRERRRSVSTHGSLRIRRRLPQSRQRDHASNSLSITSDDFQSPSEITAVTSAQEYTLDPFQRFVRNPSNTSPDDLLYSKALLFYHQRLALVAHKLFIEWRRATAQLIEDNANLEVIAVHQEQIFLARNIIRTVLTRSVEHKERIKKKDEFFAELEQRALFYRDEMLMQKAFTHWKETTLEHIETTSLARRHILRTRTFNAWKEYTVVNEFKIRRLPTKKFFSNWKQRLLAIAANKDCALQQYEAKLAKKYYSTVIHSSWALKATTWWNEGAKLRTLSRWREKIQNVQQAATFASRHKELQIKGSFVLAWKAKTSQLYILESEAAEFSWRRTLQHALKKWRKEKQVVPAKKALRTDVNSRLLRETFTIWLHHARQEMQALQIDRQKVLQEGLAIWREVTRIRLVHLQQERMGDEFDKQRILHKVCTTWRHKASLQIFHSRQESRATTIDRQRVLRDGLTSWRLNARLQVMNARLNERVLHEMIYKWTLAQQARSAERAFQERTGRKCLEKWRATSLAARRQQEAHTDLAINVASRNARVKILLCWIVRTTTEQNHSSSAVQFYSSALLQRTITKWSDRFQHNNQIEGWSRDAEFYFATSKSLKRWRDAVQNSKRDKLKAAYSKVRRLTKMSLARDVLRGWRQRAEIAIDLQNRASELRRNKDIIIGMNSFDSWRARNDEVMEMSATWKEKVLQKYSIIWRNRSSAFHDLEAEAVVNYQQRQESKAVKKWSLLNLQQMSRSHYASEVRDKHIRRNTRRIFIYWHQKIQFAKQREDVDFDTLRNTARDEAWSDFEEEVEVDEPAKDLDNAAVPSTPIPGYLSTPSKRMERVTAAVVRYSSTTPKAPLSTPFERHLRAQYSGGLVPPFRRGPGRSRLGMSEGFADIRGSVEQDRKETT